MKVPHALLVSIIVIMAMLAPVSRAEGAAAGLRQLDRPATAVALGPRDTVTIATPTPTGVVVEQRYRRSGAVAWRQVVRLAGAVPRAAAWTREGVLIVGEVPTIDGRRVFVAALDASGRVRNGFGRSGVMTRDVPGSEQVTGIGLAPGGAMLVAGSSYGDGLARGFILSLATSDGSLSRAFGSQGLALVPQLDHPVGVAAAPSGGVWLAGSTTTGDGMVMMAARLRADGTLDTTFGAQGTAALFPTAQGEALAIKPTRAGVAVAGVAYDGDTPQLIHVQMTTAGVVLRTVARRLAAPTDSINALSLADSGMYGVAVGLRSVDGGRYQPIVTRFRATGPLSVSAMPTSGDGQLVNVAVAGRSLIAVAVGCLFAPDAARGLLWTA